jgi:hypothetical protein
VLKYWSSKGFALKLFNSAFEVKRIRAVANVRLKMRKNLPLINLIRTVEDQT